MKLLFSFSALTSGLLAGMAGATSESTLLRRTEILEPVWCEGDTDPFPSTCDAERYLLLDVMDATGVDVGAIIAFRTVLSNFMDDILEGAYKDMIAQNLTVIEEANIENAIVEDDVLIDMFWDELCLIQDDNFCYFGYEMLPDNSRRELALNNVGNCASECSIQARQKKKKINKKKKNKKKSKKKKKQQKKRSRMLRKLFERILNEAIVTEERILTDAAAARLEYMVLEVAGNLVATVADDAAAGRSSDVMCDDIVFGVEETSENPSFYLDGVTCQ